MTRGYFEPEVMTCHRSNWTLEENKGFFSGRQSGHSGLCTWLRQTFPVGCVRE